jgi:hypothetical protein
VLGVCLQNLAIQRGCFVELPVLLTPHRDVECLVNRDAALRRVRRSVARRRQPSLLALTSYTK